MIKYNDLSRFDRRTINSLIPQFEKAKRLGANYLSLRLMLQTFHCADLDGKPDINRVIFYLVDNAFLIDMGHQHNFLPKLDLLLQAGSIEGFMEQMEEVQGKTESKYQIQHIYINGSVTGSTIGQLAGISNQVRAANDAVIRKPKNRFLEFILDVAKDPVKAGLTLLVSAAVTALIAYLTAGNHLYHK